MAAAPALAFEIFTAAASRWWPRTHTIGTSPMQQAIIEPRVGGRWYERGEDGSECDWGKVLAWEPPSRLLLAWHLDARFRYDADAATEVEVRFIADGPNATRVELEHRGLERLGKEAEAVRERFAGPGGWSLLLDRFAAVTAEQV